MVLGFQVTSRQESESAAGGPVRPTVLKYAWSQALALCSMHALQSSRLRDHCVMMHGPVPSESGHGQVPGATAPGRPRLLRQRPKRRRTRTRPAMAVLALRTISPVPDISCYGSEGLVSSVSPGI